MQVENGRRITKKRHGNRNKENSWVGTGIQPVQQVSYGPLIMSTMLIMSCYTGFFNVRRGWQSRNTKSRFYLRLIRRTGQFRTTDGPPFKPQKLSVPFIYPGVPAGLAPFRGLVPLGRRNLVPILLPAHPLGGGRGGCRQIIVLQSSISYIFMMRTNLQPYD